MSRLFLFICALATCTAQARTILISDIDDTLKIAHVRAKGDALDRAYDTSLYFQGMAELFGLLKSRGGVELFYVSNAPSWLMEDSHREFLKRWKFPRGEVHLRESIFDGNFKMDKITEILKQARPEEVIFLGDNGEKDPAIYRELAEKFPEIRFLTFIRIAYSGKEAGIHQGQMGFVTPVEISLLLSALGVVPEEAARSYTEVTAGEAALAQDVGRGAGFFADWMDCRDFQWQSATRSLGLTAYNRKIQERCELPAE